MWNHSIPSCFSHPGGSRRGCDPCYGCRGGQKVTRLHCRALQTKCRLVSAGTGEVGQHMRVHMGWSLKCIGYLVHHQYHCFNGSLGGMPHFQRHPYIWIVKASGCHRFPSRCFTIMNVCSCRIAATSGILIIILESLTWGKNKVSRLAVCAEFLYMFQVLWFFLDPLISGSDQWPSFSIRI